MYPFLLFHCHSLDEVSDAKALAYLDKIGSYNQGRWSQILIFKEGYKVQKVELLFGEGAD